MKRFSIASIFLLAVSLACALQVAPPVMTAVPTATDTPETVMTGTATDTAAWTSTVSRAQINVRAEPDGDVIGNLKSGDTVTIDKCTVDWCKVLEPKGADWGQPFAWIWRGCLSDNPQKLGCEAK